MLGHTPAHAQDADERARTLYQLGNEQYANGRYEDAIAAFEEAYELSQRPLLLFNLANAQERAGLYAEAVESLRAYEEHADNARERARIASRIESLEERAERVRALTETPEDPEPPVEIDTSPPEPPEEESTLSVPGVLFVSIGGAALAGGVVSALIANGARDDLDALCLMRNDRRICPQEAESVSDRDLIASIAADGLFVLGTAAIVVGLYLLFSEDEEDAPPIEASLGSDGVSARWTHEF